MPTNMNERKEDGGWSGIEEKKLKDHTMPRDTQDHVAHTEISTDKATRKRVGE